MEPASAAGIAAGEVLRGFHAAGGRWVDSSPMYGRAEAALGALSVKLGLNGDLRIATKVWTRGREDGERQMRESLRRLGRGRLELMQVHNLLDWRAHWPTLTAWRAEGRFGALGLTHYDPGAFGELERLIRAGGVDWVQFPYNLRERTAERSLLAVAAEHGVRCIANEPFAQGALFARVRGRAVPAWAAAELDLHSWAAYFLKWILADPRVSLVIPATGDPAHLKEILGVLKGPLPDARQRRRMEEDFAA